MMITKSAVTAFLLTTVISLSAPKQTTAFLSPSNAFCRAPQLQMGAATYEEVMDKMKAKDKTSVALSKEVSLSLSS